MKTEIKKLNVILKDWTKIDDVLIALNKDGIKMNKRQWQGFVAMYNRSYGERSTYIASSSKGYKLTRKNKEIEKSCYQRIRKAASMIKNAKETLKEIGEYNQLSVLLQIDADLDDIVSSLGE